MMTETTVISSKLEGLWDLKNIIGAPCSIKSTRGALRELPFDILSDQQIIESINFRVLSDGKLFPIFKLKGIDNLNFTADQLQIEGIVLNIKDNGTTCRNHGI